MKCIAKTLEGLEQVLAAELLDLGAEDITIVKRAVLFSANLLTLYKCNLMLRTCLRVLVYVREFEICSEQDLYDGIVKIPWEDYFSLENTFAIDSVVNSSQFRHANYIALKTKDAIADRFREKYGSRPNVDTANPDMRINLHLRDKTVTVSLDSSGSSLHMRGYRKRTTDAPLNEVLAAGLVLLSEWDGKTTLIDPMCGSGTILCEAARIAARVPAQEPGREFGFKKWNTYDPELWNMAVQQANDEILTSDLPELKGYDLSKKALEAAKFNIEVAGLSSNISLEAEDFFYHEGREDAFLIFNPPYDERLKEKDILLMYTHIGDKLKSAWPGCTAWILSGHPGAMKNIGLRPSRKISLLNGSIPSVFARFDMYRGSKKQKWQQTSDGEST